MLFGSASRGVPSFGDLSWKRPVLVVTDPATAWDFPTPVLSPTGAASFGQTLTAGFNQDINSAAPVAAGAGATLAVGDRLLVSADGGVANTPGIWVVTTVGSGSVKWKLTRATDADSAAELPEGTITFMKSGLAPALWYQDGGGDWFLIPQLLQALMVQGSSLLGINGAVDPSVEVTNSLAADALWLDNANRDIRLTRTGTEALKIADASGNALASILMNAADIYTAKGVKTNFTISGGGSATFGSKEARYVQIGKVVLFTVTFTVTANGSGGTAVTTGTLDFPTSDLSPITYIGDRGVTGVQPIAARMANGTGFELSGIKVLTATGTSATLTGADMVNTAKYSWSGIFLVA